MLKPDKDRLNYSELLTPPSGFEVEFAVGTTYSMDLEALMGVPLALSLIEEMDQTFDNNPIYILEGIRRTSNRFAVFCEAGQIKVPQNNNVLFALLEDSVFEVALKNEKAFHPKIWLLKYIDGVGGEKYRLLVLTRNLTFDRSWDIAIALEGKKTKQTVAKNQPLVDFLKFLVPFAKRDDKRIKIEKLLSELKYVQFESGISQIPDFDFHPVGIDGYGKEETGIFTTYHHLVVISPFITGTIVQELNNYSLSNPQKVLITRKTELSKLNESILSDFEIYVLKDTIIEGEGSISEESEIAQLQDIHAKLYARTKYNEHLIYIGSANSSTNAFQGNVEFLLKLKYKKRNFKIMDIVQDLFGEKEEDNPFEKVESIPIKEESEKEIAEALQKGIKNLCRTQSKAFVREKNEEYSIKLIVEEVPSGMELTIGPLLSKQEQKLEEETVFEKLSVLELGEFYRVTAKKDGEKVERVIKIPTEGIPTERESAIFRTLINNPHTFLRYVAFLLSEDLLLSALEQLNQDKTGNGMWDIHAGNFPVLYENMLRAASRSHEKLADIHHVIAMIDDDEVIPEEFYTLYNTFQSAAKKVRK